MQQTVPYGEVIIAPKEMAYAEEEGKHALCGPESIFIQMRVFDYAPPECPRARRSDYHPARGLF